MKDFQDQIQFIADAAEILVDKKIQSEALKDIPIVGTIANILKFADTVSERIFIKKLTTFLTCLEGIDSQKIQDMVFEIDTDQKYGQKVGEKILELISRIDSDGKPELVGNLFRNFIAGNIPYISFLKFSHLVERCLYQELIYLVDYDEKGHIYTGDSEELRSVGLTNSLLYDDQFDLGYEGAITQLGVDLVKYAFNRRDE